MRRLIPTVVVAALTAAAPAATAEAARPPKPTHELATLLSPHKVVSAPSARASRLTTVRASRPITGAPTVLPVLRSRTVGKIRWLRVLVPGRPNGRAGWIKARATVRSTTSWALAVRTSRRRVDVYRRGVRVRSLVAIVGSPSTPTPRGRFFVEESVAMLPGSPGGPFALALSARSNVLQEFDGGPGQTAIHGMSGLSGVMGTAVSHGCVRLSESGIRWLVARISPGVRVAITR
jgi:lipoprotein-anchoring transpeptidase ErfK/SrfK